MTNLPGLTSDEEKHLAPFRRRVASAQRRVKQILGEHPRTHRGRLGQVDRSGDARDLVAARERELEAEFDRLAERRATLLPPDATEVTTSVRGDDYMYRVHAITPLGLVEIGICGSLGTAEARRVWFKDLLTTRG